ncbi:GNAT family N-acetyltransferase [Dermacoccaceae bacterium W4C1]
MAAQIRPADLANPSLRAFLQAHLRDMEPTAPPESRHALDLAGLARPGVRLWIIEEAGQIIATGATATLIPAEPGHEEIKSMRVDPVQRGRGLAREMVTHLIEDARARGVRRLSLETGSMEFFAPARALYAAAGFVECAPFGGYRPDANSFFMSKTLTGGAPPHDARRIE